MPSWMYGGVERGFARDGDMCFVKSMQSVIAGDGSLDDVLASKEVAVALELGLPVLKERGDSLQSVTIEFPFPDDDGIVDINPVAAKFFEKMGWGPSF